MPIDGVRIEEILSRGYGKAARALGTVHEHYRPAGPLDPLDPLHRLGTLPVAVDAQASYKFGQPALHQVAQRYVLVQRDRVQHGDYLVPAAGPPVFIAVVPTLQPVVAVSCNAVLAIRRLQAPEEWGPIEDRPDTQGEEVEIARGWPASLRYASRGAGDDVDLPGDAPPAQYMALLPAIPGIDPLPRSGDVLQDERGRRLAVAWTELTELGWRLAARLLEL